MRNLQLLAAFFLFFGSIDSLSSLRQDYPVAIQRIRDAIVAYDRDALKDLFTSDFKLRLGYKNVSADGTIDWLLDRKNHSAFHSLAITTNPNYYASRLSFKRTPIQLIIYVQKSNGKISEAAMQRSSEVPEEDADTRPTDLEEFRRKVVEAVNEKNKTRIRELMGSGYVTNLSPEEKLLNAFTLRKLFNSSLIRSSVDNSFDIILLYENGRTIRIHGLVYKNDKPIEVTYIGAFNPSTTTSTSTTTTTPRPPPTTTSTTTTTPRPPPTETTPVVDPVHVFHDALIRAVYQKDRKDVHDLLITYNSTDLNEKVKEIISHDLERSRIETSNNKFTIALEYKDGTVIKVQGRLVDGQIYIRKIYLVKNPTVITSKPVQTTPKPILSGAKFYEELVKAIKKSDRNRVEVLIGTKYTTNSTATKEELLDKFIGNLEHHSYKIYGFGSFRIVLQYKSKLEIQITGYRGDSSNIHITIGKVDPYPVDEDPTRHPEEFYKKLVAAIKKKDERKVRQTLGKNYKTNVKTEQILLKEFTQDLESSIFNKTGNFVIELIYTSGTTITIRAQRMADTEYSHVLTITVNKPEKIPVDARKFYELLVKAIREKKANLVKRLIGERYKVNVDRKKVIEYLLQDLKTNSFRQVYDFDFEVHLDYSNGQRIIVKLSETDFGELRVNVDEIRVLIKGITARYIFEQIRTAVQTQDRPFLNYLIGYADTKNHDAENVLLSSKGNISDSKYTSHPGKFEFYITLSNGKKVVFSGIDTGIGKEVHIDSIQIIDGTTTPKVTTATTVPVTTPRRPESPEEFYKLLVKAIREKDEKSVGGLIGNHYKTNVDRKSVIKYLIGDLNNSTMKDRSTHAIITLDYANHQRIIVNMVVNDFGTRFVRVVEIRVFLKPESGEQLFEELGKAIKNKDQVYTYYLIRLFKTEEESNNVVKVLLSSGSVIGSDYQPWSWGEFRFYFDFSNGKRVIFDGSKSDHRNEISIESIKIVILQDVQDGKDLRKIRVKFEGAIRTNNTNALNVLIDKDFKMIYDQEESQSNKQRIIRALLEKTLRIEDIEFNKKLTRDAPYYVTVHGVLTKNGQSGNFEASFNKGKSEHDLILMRAKYEKDIIRRKSAQH